MNRRWRTLALALVALWPCLAAGGERWRVQYFYDPAEDSEFSIADLAFPSARVGMAAGQIAGRGKPKPYAVSTSDGGRTWVPVAVPEVAISLFFLDEHTGWLVASNSIWRTGDFGQHWTRLKPAPNALRVYFRDEKRGWAVGGSKSVWQTGDGGATWTAVGAAGTPASAREHSVYGAIAFADPKFGLIMGWSKPPRPGDRGRAPDWVDPEGQPREWPGLAISLQTKDGGETWKASETSMFGQSTALSLAGDGRGLLLVEFFGRFDYPSEVYRMDLGTGKSTRAFRRKDRAVTDVLIEAQGPAYLAAVEPTGTLFHSPVPGKLKVLKSEDLEKWTDMEVDYRAIARRACLAAADRANVWVATDTGMILKLSE
jgi:photosystem II stability/assembly factor-like uncharacterized protein